MKEKLADVAEFDNYTMFKRKNIYNEDDKEFQGLPEENMIVVSWINDMGQPQNFFDVSLKALFLQDKLLFFNNETLLNMKLIKIPEKGEFNHPTTILDHFNTPELHIRTLYESNIEFVCKKGGLHKTMNTNHYMPYKQN